MFVSFHDEKFGSMLSFRVENITVVVKKGESKTEICTTDGEEWVINECYDEVMKKLNECATPTIENQEDGSNGSIRGIDLANEQNPDVICDQEYCYD